MKTNRSPLIILLYLATWLVWIRLPAAPLSSFTYQGRLTGGGTPLNGIYELRLTLYDRDALGTVVGPVLSQPGVAVSNGLFTTIVDFGPGVFDGSNYWLEVAIRTNATPGGFSPLLPRQRITASPYALYAPNAGAAVTASVANSASTAGSVAWSGLTAVPAGFADGVDNETNYAPGLGLLLNGNRFSVNFAGTGTAATAARSDHVHSAQDLTSGTLPDERLAGTYTASVRLTNPNNLFAGDGSQLKALNAENIAGILSEERIDPLVWSQVLTTRT